MEQKAIPMVSGFAITLLGGLALWQLLIVVLLVRAMTYVLGALGRLL
jgi:hypothetical protein